MTDFIPWWVWLLVMWLSSHLMLRSLARLSAHQSARGPVYLSPREGETKYVCELVRAQDMAFDEDAQREVDAIVTDDGA